MTPCPHCNAPLANPNARFCNVCGWRKGGVDSWDGVRCKCGHAEPPIQLIGADRIAADRIWRDPDAQYRFQIETGMTDAKSPEYQERFREWAFKSINGVRG